MWQLRSLFDLREAGPAAHWLFPALSGAGPIGAKPLGKHLSDRQRVPERRLRGRAKATSAMLLPGGR
jgi:hypothetical protein